MSNFLRDVYDSELFIENFIYEYNIFLPPFPSLTHPLRFPPNFMSSSFLKLSESTWYYVGIGPSTAVWGAFGDDIPEEDLLPPPSASVRCGISWAPPSPMLGGILAGFILAAQLLCMHASHCESCVQGPCHVTADVHCLWLLPSAPSHRVISEPSGMGSDVAIHLECTELRTPQPLVDRL